MTPTQTRLVRDLKLMKTALLVMSMDDLISFHTGTPRDPSKLEDLRAARANAMATMGRLSHDEATACLMAAEFLKV